MSGAPWQLPTLPPPEPTEDERPSCYDCLRECVRRAPAGTPTRCAACLFAQRQWAESNR